MIIRNAHAYERCSDHYPSFEKAVVTVVLGDRTVPLCKRCLAAFWRGIAARLDDAGELAAKINEGERSERGGPSAKRPPSERSDEGEKEPSK